MESRNRLAAVAVLATAFVAGGASAADARHDSGQRRAGPLSGARQRLQRLPYAGVSGVRRQGARRRLAGRERRSASRDRGARPTRRTCASPSTAMTETQFLARAARRCGSADAVVQPAGDDRRRSPRDVSLVRSLGPKGAPAPRTQRRTRRSRPRTSCSCRRTCRRRPRRAEPGRVSSQADDFGELHRPLDAEPKAAAAGLLDPHVGRASSSRRRCSSTRRASRLSAMSGRRMAGSSRSSRLVNSVRPSSRVVAQQLPQDRAGHALDQVVVVEEHAVVRGVVPHGDRVPRVASVRRVPAPAALSSCASPACRCCSARPTCVARSPPARPRRRSRSAGPAGSRRYSMPARRPPASTGTASWLPRRRQARQRNLGLQPVAEAARERALADRAAVGDTRTSRG